MSRFVIVDEVMSFNTEFAAECMKRDSVEHYIVVRHVLNEFYEVGYIPPVVRY